MADRIAHDAGGDEAIAGWQHGGHRGSSGMKSLGSIPQAFGDVTGIEDARLQKFADRA
jgi:hypothetical protein